MAFSKQFRSLALRIAMVVAVPAIAGAALAQGAPQAIGIASAVLNDVKIASAGAAQPRPAVLRQRLALADRVQTGARSQLQVLLLDRAVFTVGANARLTIDRFVYDPATGRSFSATVAKGAFRFMSGRPNRGGTSAINTPVSSIGIRGTIVEGVVGEDAIAIAGDEKAIGQKPVTDENATLIVLRGPGPGTQGSALPGEIDVTSGGKSITLDRPMQAAYVPGEGAEPIGPFVISNAGLARLRELVFPSLAALPQAQAKPKSRPRFRINIGIPIGGGGSSGSPQSPESPGTPPRQPNDYPRDSPSVPGRP